jgi:hypothetical protein
VLQEELVHDITEHIVEQMNELDAKFSDIQSTGYDFIDDLTNIEEIVDTNNAEASTVNADNSDIYSLSENMKNTTLQQEYVKVEAISKTTCDFKDNFNHQQKQCRHGYISSMEILGKALSSDGIKVMSNTETTSVSDTEIITTAIGSWSKLHSRKLLESLTSKGLVDMGIPTLKANEDTKDEHQIQEVAEEDQYIASIFESSDDSLMDNQEMEYVKSIISSRIQTETFLLGD